MGSKPSTNTHLLWDQGGDGPTEPGPQTTVVHKLRGESTQAAVARPITSGEALRLQ